jgi:hypothetical protein
MRLNFCVACGDPGHLNRLEHHHLVPRSRGGTDDETNLVTLCRACHGKAHGAVWGNDVRLLISEGQARARAEGITLWQALQAESAPEARGARATGRRHDDGGRGAELRGVLEDHPPSGR